MATAQDVATRPRRLQNWIAGQWTDADATGVEPVYNPATGEVLAETPLSSAGDVDKAVKAAEAMFDQWRETTVFRRVQVMFRYKQLLDEHLEELAQLVTREHGKIISEARSEVQRGIEVVEFATS